MPATFGSPGFLANESLTRPLRSSSSRPPDRGDDAAWPTVVAFRLTSNGSNFAPGRMALLVAFPQSRPRVLEHWKEEW